MERVRDRGERDREDDEERWRIGSLKRQTAAIGAESRRREQQQRQRGGAHSVAQGAATAELAETGGWRLNGAARRRGQQREGWLGRRLRRSRNRGGIATVAGVAAAAAAGEGSTAEASGSGDGGDRRLRRGWRWRRRRGQRWRDGGAGSGAGTTSKSARRRRGSGSDAVAAATR
ncbi:hypothetical protein Syun_006703 [Stephania yunnanensis]|uniref:Uncharacterized protein n=1 Tax=Stephania yunnanensis TaxID=152371 RepID=A0AAP0KX14_9MAGN